MAPLVSDIWRTNENEPAFVEEIPDTVRLVGFKVRPGGRLPESSCAV